MNPAEFRRHGHELVEWIADYLEHVERYPVLSRVRPGDIAAALPASAPEDGEPFDAIMADFERVLVPGLTHWNHPGFFAYFAITASAPGILAEFLSAALNQQAMLWRTSPASTELEAVIARLAAAADRPAAIPSKASSTTPRRSRPCTRCSPRGRPPLTEVRVRGLAGRRDLPPLRVYCSEQAHSSIDKSVIAIGLGHESLRRIPVDDEYRMRPDALARRDRRGSRRRPSADRRRRHCRHDVNDERRSGRGDR